MKEKIIEKKSKEKENSADKFKDKIEGQIKINFGISSCPLPLFEDFKQICNKDFADTYHLALRYFVDLYKGRNETDAIWDVIHKLHERIAELEMRVDEVPVIEEHNKVESSKPKIITFGKEEKEE